MKWNWNRSAVLRYLKQLISLNEHIDTGAAATSIRNSVPFRGPNVYILFCAIIIASVGLNVNSIPVIIGAMLVSPLMGPIMGFGLGLGINDTALVRTSLKNLAVMVGISILASSLYFWISPLSMENPTELLARTEPTIYDVFIALFGGFAGILETSRKERGTVMSGVAIATALMPPLCTVGYGIATLSWQYTLGALYLFLINSILIALATFLAVKYLRYPVIQDAIGHKRRNTISIVLVILILVIPSVLSAISVVRENNFSIRANRFIAQHKTIGTSYIYDTQVNPSKSTMEFFLAGEALSEADRTLFLAEAIQAGFDSTAIVLHVNALATDNALRHDQLVKDLFASKEEQIASYQQQIIELREQLAKAERRNTRPVFATAQLTEEVRTQYPTVEHIAFAQGEQLITLDDSTKTTQPITIVSVTTHSTTPMDEAECNRLKDWLRIRLGAEHLDVIVR